MAEVGPARIVEIGLPHLHELADDCAVGEQLDLLGQQTYLAREGPGDLALGIGYRVFGIHSRVSLAARVDQER